MPIDFFFSIVHVYLVLTFDVFNIKILIISLSFLGVFFFFNFKKAYELLKAEHLRF